MDQVDCVECEALGAEVCGPCAQELRRLADEMLAAAYELAEERRRGQAPADLEPAPPVTDHRGQVACLGGYRPLNP